MRKENPASNLSVPGVRAADVIAVLSLFTSGAVSLVYEICWIRKATLVFGATTPAVSTVLAVFFGGLALGSYVFGRYAQRTSRPLTVYAGVLIGLGIAGLASPHLFFAADWGFGRLYPVVRESPAAVSLVRAGLIAAILAPPTILMGGTLPLFCRRFVRRSERISWSVGLLYAGNTLGAAIGCAACGFYLIPRIGVNTSLYAGGIVSVTMGLLLWRLYGRAVAGESSESEHLPASVQQAPPGPLIAQRKETLVVYTLFFASGLTLLANEVLWTRYLSLLARNTVYTYTSTITVILTGMVLGSVLTSRLFDRTRRRAFIFGLVQVLTGLVVLAVLMLPASWWGRMVVGADIYEPVGALLLILLAPAVLSGVAFPLAVRMVVREPALAGIGVGTMGAVNTVGGTIGSLAAGFLALPLLGLQKSILLTTGTSVLIGLAAWLLLERGMPLLMRLVPAALAVAAWVAIPAVTGTRLPADFLAPRERMVEFREGLNANLAVVRGDGFLRLEIDRLWQGENRKRHQIMAAHVPALLHAGPSDVLVIGTGTGQTASRFLMHETRRLDCVDIEPELMPLVKRHFDSAWMEDERVHLIVDDGRSYLAHASTSYDIISVEVGQVFRPSVASFYAVEFYREARRRLKPGGLLCQFAPVSFFTEPEFRTIVRTFIEVFPASVLWYNTGELLLIGTAGDRIGLRPDRLARIESDDVLRADLAWAHWAGPAHWLNHREVFLAGFLAGAKGLEEIAQGGAVYRDDRPFLEYATARLRPTEETGIVDRLRAGLEPVDVLFDGALPPAAMASAGVIRDQNLRDIVAEAMKREVEDLRAGGRHRQAVGVLRQALGWNPDSLELNLLLGDELTAAGDFAAAVSPLQRAVDIHPGSDKAHYGLAHALHRLGRLPEAIHHYRESLRLDPNQAEAHNNLGSALAQAGDLEAAQAHFAEAVRLDPGDAGTRDNLARVLRLTGRIEANPSTGNLTGGE